MYTNFFIFALIIVIFILILSCFIRFVNNEKIVHFLRYYTKNGIDGPIESVKTRVFGEKENSVPLRLDPNKMPPDLGKYKILIDNAIEEHLEKYRNTTFMPIMRDSVKSGKRIRGAIMLSIVDKYAPQYMEAASKLSLYIEFMHCASLIFDDIMDEDIYRRGSPSIYYKYGIGKAQMASLMLIASVAPMYDTYANDQDIENPYGLIDSSIITDGSSTKLFPGKYKFIFAEKFANAGKLLAEGQMLDLESDTRKISDNDAHELVNSKTASLFELAISLGYEIAHIDSGTYISAYDEEVKLAARDFGFAFQIADDFDDLEQDLKSVGGKEKNYVLRYGAKEAQDKLKQIHTNCILVFEKANILTNDIRGMLDIMCGYDTSSLIRN